MGCWMMAKDRIELTPEVDDAFIREFIEFSIISCPKKYCTEKFANCWFFDSENRLVCKAGKFAEPGIWYKHLKKYLFKPWRFVVPDKISIIGEGDEGFWELAEDRSKEYEEWMIRRDKILDSISEYDTLFSFMRKQGFCPPLPSGYMSKS